MWADIRNHWKYLVGLFIWCILLVLPIYININALSACITNTGNQILHLAYFYYGLSILTNGLFLYNVVEPYYLILYVLWIVLFVIFNPFHIITTVFPMMPLVFITIGLMILLVSFDKDLLSTLFIFLLTLILQMALYSFSLKPTFILLEVLFLYLAGYYLFFKKITINLGGINTRNSSVNNYIPYLQGLFNYSKIELSGMFLLVAGIILYLYIRTVSNDYYGGQILVNDPVKLDKVITFPIEPTYHSSLSCWVYLTPSTKSENNTLFLYGEQLLVSYETDMNSLRIRLKDDISYIERKVLLQKWNHIAFVYNHGRIVLFLNGEVIHSSEWSPPSFTNELMFGKLQGKICHVRYYKEALKEQFIESLYQDFKKKNPPIV